MANNAGGYRVFDKAAIEVPALVGKGLLFG